MRHEQRTRMERERSRQKSLEAENEAARKKADADEEGKPDGAGAETPEKNGSAVATLAEARVVGAPAPSQAPALAKDRKDEVRNCLEYIVQHVCTTSGEDNEVLKKPLDGGKPPAAVAAATAASPTDTAASPVADATAGSPCHPLPHNEKASATGETVPCGDRGCKTAGPTLHPSQSGSGDSAEETAWKETRRGCSTSGANSNDEVDTKAVPADEAKRNSAAAKVARGASGDSTHSLVVCTAGEAADMDVADGASGSRSASRNQTIDGVKERTVEDTRQKNTGAAAASVVADADCPAATAAGATSVILEPDSSQNAENEKAHSSPASCEGGKAVEVVVQKTIGSAEPPARDAKNSDSGGEGQGSATYASPRDTNTSHTATDNPSHATPPPCPVATSNPVVDTEADADESPLSHLVEPPIRKREPRMGRGVGSSTGVDLYACLDHFVEEEELVVAEGNGYDCEKCRKRIAADAAARAAAGAGAAVEQTPECESEDPRDGTEEQTPTGKQDARKRLLMLGEPPGVLVCHLKRLQAQTKVRKHVEFPIDLDMAPYFWQNPKVRASAVAVGRIGCSVSSMMIDSDSEVGT